MIYIRKVFYCPTQLVPPKQKQGAGHLLDVIRTVGVQDVANLDQGPGTSATLTLPPQLSPGIVPVTPGSCPLVSELSLRVNK